MLKRYILGSGSTRNFFVDDIEGAKCVSEGEKFKKLMKLAEFMP